MLRRASEIPALLQQTSFVSSSTIEYTKHNNNSNVAPSSLTTNGVIMTTTVIKEYDQETGNKLINSFMILKEIGRGVHGKVKLAQDLETGELVAIKIVDKKNRRRQMGYSLLRGASQLQQKEQQQHVSKENEFKIRREISILEKCCHPNVVKLKQVIDDPTNRKIYMALEYTESGEIEWRDEYDQPVLSVNEARRIFRDIVSGLDYLHYQGIIHRDIKPANLLMSRNKIAKISDFGVSYYNVLLSQAYAKHNIEQDMLSKIDRELAETAGTPAFFAPELCCAGTTTTSTNGGKRPRISKAIDVWALGVTLYCFIFGQCPFIAATEFELFDTIPTQPLTFPASKEGEQEEIDDSLKDLLNKLLTKNPDDRFTLDQVKRHPWVTKDLKNPEEWISNTDPRHYITQEQQVIITKEFQQQVQQAQHVTTESVTMMDRLRQSIRKLSFSFGASSGGGGGNNSSNNMSRRKSSISALNNSRPTSFQQQLTNRLSHPTISATTLSKQPSFSTSLLPHATTSVTPTVSLSTGHTFIFNSSSSTPNNTHIPTTTPPPRPTSALHPLRPISPSYLSDEEESDLDEEEEEECQLKTSTSTATRPDISRRVSSASSSSGLGLTFGRYRGGGAAGMTPIEPSK